MTRQEFICQFVLAYVKSGRNGYGYDDMIRQAAKIWNDIGRAAAD